MRLTERLQYDITENIYFLSWTKKQQLIMWEINYDTGYCNDLIKIQLNDFHY